MANLEILQCSGCGASLTPSSLTCEYCGNKNVVKTQRNPLKLKSDVAQDYIKYFTQKAKENPKDTNAMYSMGLLYLNLKNYELAQRNFKEAIDLSPFDADMYFYYALSLIGNRPLKELHSSEIKRIEEYLNSAIAMETKCKYLMLLMAIKQEYYVQNGLKINGETPNELYERALEYAPNDLDDITEHIVLRDQDIIEKIKKAQGIDITKEAKSEKEAFVKNKKLNFHNANCPFCGSKGMLPIGNGKCYCSSCEKEIDENDFEQANDGFNFCYDYEKDIDYKVDEKSDVKELLDRGQRQLLFDYYHNPTYPTKQSKPFYPIFSRIWKLILSLVLMLIIFIVFSLSKILFSDFDVRPAQTVQQELDEYVADLSSRNKKLTKQERIDKYNELKQDSIDAQSSKEQFFASNIIIQYEDINNNKIWGKPDPNADDVKELNGVKKEWMSVVWGIVLFLPLIIWTIVTIVKCKNIYSLRKFINGENKEAIDEYNFWLEMFEKRPTIKGLRSYIYHFLSDSNSLVPYGDPVSCELERNNLNESDLKGKSLFLNYYAVDDEGLSIFSDVFYVIALLEKDCVKVFKNRWNTVEEHLDECDVKTAYYSKIQSAAIENGCLIIGDIEIVLPENDINIFAYQSTNKGNKQTYSQERTSDPKEFLKALNQLITTH